MNEAIGPEDAQRMVEDSRMTIKILAKVPTFQALSMGIFHNFTGDGPYYPISGDDLVKAGLK